MRETRDDLINALRGLGALAVALFHFNVIHPRLSDVYHSVCSFGWLGVPVFFVASGFCVANARTRAGLLSFWQRRLLRIYPAYWAALALVALVVAIRKWTTGINDLVVLPVTVHDWLYTFAALTSPASSVRSINWVAWSLGYELAFYLFIGLVAIGNQCWGVFALTLGSMPAGRFGYPLDSWGMFSLGIATFWIVGGRSRAGWLLFVAGIGQTMLWKSPVETVTASVAAILIIAPPTLARGRVFAPVRAVGDFSYSLYLIHVPIGVYVTSKYVDRWFSRSGASSVVRDAVLLTVCLAVAWCFYRWIEQPAHIFARTRSRGRRATLTIDDAAVETTSTG